MNPRSLKFSHDANNLLARRLSQECQTIYPSSLDDRGKSITSLVTAKYTDGTLFWNDISWEILQGS